jgi:hypothetical protein
MKGSSMSNNYKKPHEQNGQRHQDQGKKNAYEGQREEHKKAYEGNKSSVGKFMQEERGERSEQKQNWQDKNRGERR